MKLPFTIISNLSTKEIENWHFRFSIYEYDRSCRWNVWRRHQDESNKELSDWQSPADQRRRVIQFYDKYSLTEGNFVLDDPYLFLHLKLPKTEIKKHLDSLYSSLKLGCWSFNKGKWYRGSIMCDFKTSNKSEYDSITNRIVPNDYCFLEIEIRKINTTNNYKSIAWSALNTGIRKVEERGNPSYCSIKDIVDYLPAQVELGCGPSIEAGVPALNSLHSIYSISKNGKFVFSPQDEAFYDFLKFPEIKFSESSKIHEKSLVANPSKFYHDLKILIDKGYIINPIFTNNFDGIALSLGIEEHSLRKYDIDYCYPDYCFHPTAKSLLVIGSHADRRNVQNAARKKGLQIIFINPEGYFQNSVFSPYLLEAPKDNDFILKTTAEQFSSQLLEILGS